MQSIRGSVRLIHRQKFTVANAVPLGSSTSRTVASGNVHESRKLGFCSWVSRGTDGSIGSARTFLIQSPTASGSTFSWQKQSGHLSGSSVFSGIYGRNTAASFSPRGFSTAGDSVRSTLQGSFESASDAPQRIKFKRLDKTAKHIMQILDKEAVEEVRAQREIPDIKPGYILQLKVEVPENKRRVSTVKGIVIAMRKAGLNTTFRIRRLVAGVGVESLFPLYSPNLKEIKVLDKKKVRRAKLYYLRNKMNALKNQ